MFTVGIKEVLEREDRYRWTKKLGDGAIEGRRGA